MDQSVAIVGTALDDNAIAVLDEDGMRAAIADVHLLDDDVPAIADGEKTAPAFDGDHFFHRDVAAIVGEAQSGVATADAAAPCAHYADLAFAPLVHQHAAFPAFLGGDVVDEEVLDAICLDTVAAAALERAVHHLQVAHPAALLVWSARVAGHADTNAAADDV